MSPNIIELHAIIQSMTPNQKGNFTRHCKLNKSSNSNSLVLFDALNKLQEYDEEKLIKYLRKQYKDKLANNLSVQTNHLYKAILRIMRFVNDEKNIEAKLWNTFKDAIFLQEQGFYDRPQRMLNKLEKDAIKYDIKTLQLEIHKYKRKLIRNNNEHRDFDSVLKMNNIEDTLMEDMLLEKKLRGIYDQVFYLFQSISTIKKDTAKAILFDLETALNKIDENQCTDFNTKIYYFNSLAKLFELKSDIESIFNCMEEMHEICKAHKNASKISDFKYSKFLANYLYYLIEFNRSPDQILNMLTEIKSIETNTLNEKITQFSNIYHLELLYYIKQGAFEKIEKLMPRLLEGFDKYGDDIKLGRKATMCYNLMIYYFIKEDFDSAHTWLEKILDIGKKSKRNYILNKSKVLELLIHYEFGNTQYLKSLIPKIKKIFREDNQSELVDLIAKWMSAHYRMPLVKKDFKLAQQEFNKIDKTKNKSVPYDEIEIWLRSKVERKSMLEIAIQMFQKK